MVKYNTILNENEIDFLKLKTINNKKYWCNFCENKGICMNTDLSLYFCTNCELGEVFYNLVKNNKKEIITLMNDLVPTSTLKEMFGERNIQILKGSDGIDRIHLEIEEIKNNTANEIEKQSLTQEFIRAIIRS